jgi:DNA-binding MarR family transcriptional regulator
MNSEARHELELLEALSYNGQVTQRGLAAKLGIALGLTNIYVKRLVHKGYVKCVNAQSNRLLYLITPAGIVEKSRLTYEFMEYSFRLYRGARLRLRSELALIVEHRSARVAIYGTGEAAELAYVCLKELGIEPVAVFSASMGSTLFDVPARRICEHADVPFDIMIVAMFDDPTAVISMLEREGISRTRLASFREPRPEATDYL